MQGLALPDVDLVVILVQDSDIRFWPDMGATATRGLPTAWEDARR
jgi:hypothetical protein